MKAPVRAGDEPHRVEAVRRYDVSDASLQKALDDLTAFAAHLCEAPVACITFVDEEIQRFKSRFGISLNETHRDVSFCGHAILEPALFVVPDAAQDLRFADNPLVTGEPHIRFYAGAPLVSPAGHALGALCVIDRVPRHLKSSQLDALCILGRQVMTQLELDLQKREWVERERVHSTLLVNLRESQERLALAMDATQDGLWDWDIRTGIVHYSPQWKRLLGFAPDEVPSRVEFFFTVVHPDDVERIRRVLEEHLAGRTAVKQDEIRLKTKSGEYRWFLDRGKVVERDEQGSPLRMVGIITDITDRHLESMALSESQQRTRLLVEAAGVGLWDWNLLTNEVYFSPEWKRQLGYTDDEFPSRFEEWERRLYPADRKKTLDMVSEFQRGNAPAYDVEFRMRHKDGNWRWVCARADLVRDAGGHPVRMMGCHFDITDRKIVEAQLRQAQKMEAIGQLAGGVAHDFNNILAAIVGNTELGLVDTLPGHPAHENFTEIRAATTRAKALVQQILTFSRQQPQERRVVSLDRVIQESSAMLRAIIPATVELVTTVDTSAPLVTADPTQMQQVIVNLCTNAWHALGENAGRIQIKLNAVEFDAVTAERVGGLRAGRFACLAVSDTGEGIEPSLLERIFDPFFTTKEPGRGTGLGLSVIHGIIQAHEGVVTVASEPGQGSTFQVFLPAASGVQDLDPPVDGEVRRGNGQRVLYIDDEKPLVDTTTRMLERLGYRVAGFTHPGDAMKVFSENPSQFDLVITDMHMPQASGLQVASSFLKLRPGVPILLSSGRVTEDLRDRARALGICDVLHKPNSMEEISEAVHRFAVAHVR